MIPINISQSIDRIQIDVYDPNHKLLSNLKDIYPLSPKRLNNTRFQYHFIKDGRLKIQYEYDTKIWKHYGMVSTIQVQDVSICVQCHLLSLLNNKESWLDQIEFALDIIPFNKEDVWELYEIIPANLIFRHSRAKAYSLIMTTHYWGKEGYVRRFKDGEGKMKRVIKGLRCYPRPTDDPSYVRLELQINADYIRKHNIVLPVFPTSIDVFDFIEYRQLFDKHRLLNYLLKQERKKRKHKTKTKWSGLVTTLIKGIADSIETDDVDFLNSVTQQITNFKWYLPDLRNRLDYFFPKMAKKQQLIKDIKAGFVRRSYG